MLFCAEISTIRTVYNVLRSISINEYATVRPTEDGLKFTLEETQNLETSAYIPRSLFSSYKVKHDDVAFKISMKVLTDCLNIFGDEGNTSVKLSYKAAGAPLSLIVLHAEENMVVDCEIKTLTADESPEIALSEECNLNKVVLNAGIFVEILQRLDNATDEVTVSMGPEAPHFALSATGIAGESKVIIPKHSESIIAFQCKRKCTWTYAFKNLRHILKVMSYAVKVAVFTGETGLLGLQLIINSDEQHLYVEYYMTALCSN